MASRTKATISYILFASSVLCLAAGFVMLFLYPYIIVGIVSMFVVGVICFVIGCLLFPKDIAVKHESVVKTNVEPRKVSLFPHTSYSNYDDDEDEEDEDEWDEEEEEEEEHQRQKEEEERREEEEEEEFMMYEDDD